VLVAAPILGVVAFGRYSYAANVTTLLAFGTDLGLTLWTTRALARDPAETPAVLATGWRMRLLATAPIVLAIAAWAFALGPGEGRVAMLALGVTALARALLDHGRAVFRASERIGDEGKLNATIAVLATAGAATGLFASGRTLGGFAVGLMAGTLAGTGYGYALFRRRYGRFTGGAFDAALARRMLRDSLPFWLAGLFSLAYSRGDVVILRFLAGDAEVGAYRAAGQLFEVTKNLPALVLIALFPQLARDFRQAPARLRRAERVITLGLVAAGVVVGAALAGAAGLVARRIFGPEFMRTIPALRILALALPLLFMNFGLTHFLIVRDLGMLNLAFAGLMVAVNLTANLLLSRRLGAAGAAWSTLATEAALSICCLAALRAARRRDDDPPSPAPLSAPRDR
jgi:O-antigen/teichoic acid export membrane protein